MAVAVPKVLIVDDDAAVRGLLRVITERCGIVAEEAASGIECLDLLDRNTYDVVILDLAMQSVNGYELFEFLRRKPVCPAVIVLTAMTEWSFIGVDLSVVQCVLRKPFDLSLVSAVIVATAAAMHDRRTSRGASRPAIVRADEERSAV